MDNGRKSYRLKEWDYRTPWWYFVTICTDEHIHYSGDVVNEKMKLNKIGKIARIEWLKIEVIRDNVELDEFMIMPNHIHGIIIINKMYDDAVNGNIHRVKTKNYFSNI